jgi:hypothetical protein
VQGRGTRIDFILRRSNTNPIESIQPFFIVAECKRVNAAISNWCFIRAPYRRVGGYANCLTLERLQFDEAWTCKSSARILPQPKTNFFDIGIPVKTDRPGDVQSKGNAREAIEEAATQVLRGTNGFVEFLANQPQVLNNQKVAYILPVIFTTAKVFSSDAILNMADIGTGEIDLSKYGFTQRPWVLYQYHQSPDIKHQLFPEKRQNKLGDILEAEFVRTIAVVSASGIEDFLNWSSYIDPSP